MIKIDKTAVRPAKLTQHQLINGDLPGWSERYACYLSSLASFQPGRSNLAQGQRYRAFRALARSLKNMLPSTNWSTQSRSKIMEDIIEMGNLKARATESSNSEK